MGDQALRYLPVLPSDEVRAAVRGGQGPARPHAVPLRHADTTRYALGVMVAVVLHHWLLCLAHTVGSPVSVGRVGVAELLIYLACVPLLLRHLSLRPLIAVFAALGISGLLALLRGGYFDPKAARDVLIPLVFVWAGRSFGERHKVGLDRVMLWVMALVIVIGLAEAFASAWYGRFFNTFSYYINLGGIEAASAQVSGQSVTLNALRPEGIGRTILPALLGQQRVSSVFLEPVSLGNFAAILMAYGLAKPWVEWRRMSLFIGGAAVLIALADSRFALNIAALLFVLRIAVHGRAHMVSVVFPLLGVCGMLAVASYMPGLGDNLHGRVTVSGLTLLTFDQWAVLGMKEYATNFGDMGYAYVVSRFSLVGAAVMWIYLFALPLADERARRFRTFVSAYVTLILCVSGSSLFALKTAGVLWFVMGAMSMLGTTPVAPPVAPTNKKVKP